MGTATSSVAKKRLTLSNRKKNMVKLKEVSKGVVSTMVDMILVSVYFGFEFALAGHGRGYKAEKKAQSMIEEFDYQAIKRSLASLKRRGLIQHIKEGTLLPQITSVGRKKLNSIFPRYDTRRVWDGRLYLVTYDIPRENNKDRDRLRRFLKKIGCGLLQQSVWLTPYNPKKLIEIFVENSGLNQDLIIISSLGKEGTIGDMSLNNLMEKVYGLSSLNERYAEFLVEARESGISREEAVFGYLTILEGDPQLPFDLLPDDWLGEKAYKIYQARVKEDKNITKQ